MSTGQSDKGTDGRTPDRYVTYVTLSVIVRDPKPGFLDEPVIVSYTLQT